MEVIVYGALCPAGEEKALARRLLVEDDPCVVRANGKITITDGADTLLTLDAAEVQQVDVLADGTGREVFLNGGEISKTFYLKERRT